MYKATIEIPKGTRNKYEIQTNGTVKTSHKVKRPFACAYGYIKHTLCADGGGLDVFVFGKELKTFDEPTIETIGMVRNIDDGDADFKIIAQAQDYVASKRQIAKLLKRLKQSGSGYKMLSTQSANAYIEIKIKNYFTLA